MKYLHIFDNFSEANLQGKLIIITENQLTLIFL